MAKRYRRAVLKVGRQQPKTRKSKKADKMFKAEAPGKRRSDTGNIYYEHRQNRSDVRGTNL